MRSGPVADVVVRVTLVGLIVQRLGPTCEIPIRVVQELVASFRGSVIGIN